MAERRAPPSYLRQNNHFSFSEVASAETCEGAWRRQRAVCRGRRVSAPAWPLWAGVGLYFTRVSGSFQGNQRVFGAPFLLHSGWQLSSSLSLRAGLGQNLRRNREETGKLRGYFPGIPGIFQVYPQNTPVFCADLADLGPKPAPDSAQREPSPGN